MNKNVFFQPMAFKDVNIPVEMFIYSDIEHPVSDFIFLPHWHYEIEFWYLIEGAAEIFINNKNFILIPGDSVIANSGEVHSGKRKSKTVKYLCIRFSHVFLIKNLPYEKCPVFENYIQNDQNFIKLCARLCEEEKNNDEYYNLSVKGLFYELLVLLMRSYNKGFTNYRGIVNLCQMARVSDALKFINEHLTEKITLNQVAESSNLSVSRISHLFNETFGVSVVEYINLWRVYNGLNLLETTDYNISQIARMSGFDDSNYFSRLFKKIYHKSPSEVRKCGNKI